MSTFRLTIETPEATPFAEDVESLVIPGVAGLYGVLAGHAPMTGGVESGILAVRQGGQDRYFVVGPGVADISRQGVKLLVAALLSATHELDAADRLAVYKREAAEPPRVSVEGMS